MNTKSVSIGVGVAVLLILGLIFPRSGGTVVERVVGAAVGPESTNDYQCYNNMCSYYRFTNLAAATTTPCALLSPKATSTLLYFDFNVTVSTSTNLTMDLATSTTAFASTTIINSYTLAANKQTTIHLVGTSTPANGIGSVLYAPSTWIVMKTASASGGPSQITGNCQAEFKGVK